MKTIGTNCFVNFTKACDYYKTTDDYTGDETPAEVEKVVREKIAEGDIEIGPPSIRSDEKLIIIDGGTRYAIESPDIDEDEIRY